MKIVNSITMLSDSLKSQEPSEIEPPKADNKNTAPSAVSGESSSSPKDDTPLELPQPPIPQENNQENTASRTITVWSKEHEINVLRCILEYYKVDGVYPFVDNENMQKFYQEWIEWRGVYVDEDVFFNKMVELSERFHLHKQMVISGQNVVASMESNDLQIYQLSCLIWGKEDEDGDDDSDDDPVLTKFLNDVLED
ncbi:ulp1 protease family, C-terminal catalytic domain-containing protein [Tanacetum coccineum]|uniref:Ulp1 protease family, C-terminal catalytic domain-containing protein n=1 Tax=Tanacetum coccineum TaxID=301880 RepID=A0ABQ5FZX3_9ASTR